MTERKSLKRQVRSRMAKTGERYTAARANVVRKAGEPPVDPAALGLMPEETVVARTGRGWSEWFALLDAWGAGERSHPEIARWVSGEHGVSGWWAQTITVGYERATGRRAVHERAAGAGFEFGVSKTVGAPVERLFAAVTDPAWPEPGKLRVRTAQAGRTARFDWEDGETRVAAYFTAKGDAKSSVTLQHGRLADAAAVERMKVYWRERLAELKRALEESA